MNTTNVPVTVCKGGGPQTSARLDGQGSGGDGAFADLLVRASNGGTDAPEGAISEGAIQDARPGELDWGARGSLSDGGGVDLPHMGPGQVLLPVDSAPSHGVAMDVMVALSSGTQVLVPAVTEALEEVKYARTWAPEPFPSPDPCHGAVSAPLQRDEGGKDAPALELLCQLPSSPETKGPGHGHNHGGSVPLDTSMEGKPMRPPVEGGDGSVAYLDMETELSRMLGLDGWERDARGMCGQPGLGRDHAFPIPLPGPGGESQEAPYTLTPPLGTVGGAGLNDQGTDIRPASALSLGRGALGASSGGSHGHLVNLIVDPPHLGPFRVKIQVRGGDVRALFLADGGVQKAALETGLWDLRQRLVHQGLSVQELAVQVGAHGGEGWQGYLSRGGTLAPQGASMGGDPAPEQQVSFTGAATVSRPREGGTLDLLI